MKKIKALVDKICESLDRISTNVKENSTKLDELNNIINKNGIANLKINDYSTISSYVDTLENRIKDRPTEEKSVDLINREIDYRNTLEELTSKNADLYNFMNIILYSCKDLDKYQLLIKAIEYSEQYIVIRRPKHEK